VRLLRDREDWGLLLLALGCLGLAFLFAKFGSEVLEGELRAADIVVRNWVLDHQSRVARAIFSAITFLGAKELLVPAGLIVGWFLFRGTKGWVLLVIFCALASAEFVGLLKRVYQVGRPAGGIERSMGLSFPSGHSSGSAALLIFLGYVAVRHRISAWIVAPVVGVTVLLVGISRIYLDMHWMSDVLGGWTIGAAFGVGSCALFELIQRHRGTSRTLGNRSRKHAAPAPDSAS
jgi:membrane-associated phospholipid phosphatase